MIAYRRFDDADRTALLDLLSEVKPAIFRLSNPMVYKALIREALSLGNIILLIAEEDHHLLGYVCAAKNWRSLKKTFFLRHPLVGVSFLIRFAKTRFRRRSLSLHKNPPPSVQYSLESSVLPDDPQNPNWNDDDATVAKIIHIGVREGYRSRGIAANLYAALANDLKAGGFSRIDAHIDQGNQASVKMHQKAGWEVVTTPEGYFSYRILQKDENKSE